jgi:hypothetical protein
MFAQTLQQQRGFGSDFRFPGAVGGNIISRFLGLGRRRKNCV